MNTKNKRRLYNAFKISLVLLGLALLTVFSINAMVIASTKDQIVTVDQLDGFESDCVLVLGAGVWKGNVPSPILKDRLDKAIEIAKSGHQTTLLMSGDHGRIDYDEVNVMKAYAIDQGLNSSDIFMDHAGFSTYESLARAKRVFGVKSLIIVSQRSHLYRALYLAKALGLKAVGVAAEDIAYGGDGLRELREIAARNKDVLTALIQPDPTYLGELIPIDSNGDLTNDR